MLAGGNGQEEKDGTGPEKGSRESGPGAIRPSPQASERASWEPIQAAQEPVQEEFCPWCQSSLKPSVVPGPQYWVHSALSTPTATLRNVQHPCSTEEETGPREKETISPDSMAHKKGTPGLNPSWPDSKASALSCFAPPVWGDTNSECWSWG